MKKYLNLLLGFILIISMMSGCTGNNLSGESNDSAEQSKHDEVVFADNDYVTATFEKIYDATDMGVEGVFYININVKNKTDKEIWVYLDKASVNDEMVPLVGSGVPLYILPEKSGRTGFLISFSSLSITSIDEVKNIGFDLVVADRDSMNEINRVEAVSLDF